ncbi:hypothetical protein LX59_01251 [Azomonas agilis]|uniref:Uncharacterized protein n=1 Tax=Azomonas agilis TaxID=116849 RepID=A0A562IZG8_9GAMM|nr:hypothetical protein [Azomonas agilis]TWH76328.1 hypothetical protein LX59_01251 [Azomonas agilis]
MQTSLQGDLIDPLVYLIERTVQAILRAIIHIFGRTPLEEWEWTHWLALMAALGVLFYLAVVVTRRARRRRG